MVLVNPMAYSMARRERMTGLILIQMYITGQRHYGLFRYEMFALAITDHTVRITVYVHNDGHCLLPTDSGILVI